MSKQRLITCAAGRRFFRPGWRARSGTGKYAATCGSGRHRRSFDRADVNAWLDGYMPYALKSGDIAGAVVVVVKDGQVLTERGYGYSDVEKRTPVDPALTLFRPGSVSKLLTWTAVMQLVEQGKIDLDADINQYLDFKIPEPRWQAHHHAQPDAAHGRVRGTGPGHHLRGSEGSRDSTHC